MLAQEQPASTRNRPFPEILPLRQRSEVIHRILKKRLDTILPMAMRETGIDMWLILCQEDDLDPVFKTLTPMDLWCPILQILVLYDRGEGEGVERINISGTNTHDLYDRPYRGQVEEEQWPLLMKIIEERDPKRIGINTGSIEWAAGGLTHNLYLQLVEKLPSKYVERLESAEPLATRWISTLTDEEIELYEYVVNVAHHLIAESYSRKAIVPGLTTVDDLHWYYWERCASLGLEVSFRPGFGLVRSEAMKEKYGESDQIIRAGDFVRCDVGIRYLRLTTDNKAWVYVRRPGEQDVPEGMKHLMAQGNRLQDIFMSEFELGLTGDELLENILTRARREGLPKPKVYSHSLGHFLHEPGPLIGLPWEQDSCAGRGAVKLEYNYAFTMELSVRGPLPEWGGQEIAMALEEDVVFTEQGCRLIDGRQTEFYLI
ncbi:MAG: M24 family metallopeptidase [Chloroflexota bacterium]